jgi:hypothetical protein
VRYAHAYVSIAAEAASTEDVIIGATKVVGDLVHGL